MKHKRVLFTEHLIYEIGVSLRSNLQILQEVSLFSVQNILNKINNGQSIEFSNFINDVNI